MGFGVRPRCDAAGFPREQPDRRRSIRGNPRSCLSGEPGWTEQVRKHLREVAGTMWGREVLAINPGFQHIYDGLAESGEDGTSRIKTIHSLEDLYTFSALINRTRRRDIGEFTTRKAETVSTEFTPSQKALHDDLLGVIARVLARLHGSQNVMFMMTVPVLVKLTELLPPPARTMPQYLDVMFM